MNTQKHIYLSGLALIFVVGGAVNAQEPTDNTGQDANDMTNATIEESANGLGVLDKTVETGTGVHKVPVGMIESEIKMQEAPKIELERREQEIHETMKADPNPDVNSRPARREKILEARREAKKPIREARVRTNELEQSLKPKKGQISKFGRIGDIAGKAADVATTVDIVSDLGNGDFEDAGAKGMQVVVEEGIRVAGKKACSALGAGSAACVATWEASQAAGYLIKETVTFSDGRSLGDVVTDWEVDAYVWFRENYGEKPEDVLFSNAEMDDLLDQMERNRTSFANSAPQYEGVDVNGANQRFKGSTGGVFGVVSADGLMSFGGSLRDSQNARDRSRQIRKQARESYSDLENSRSSNTGPHNEGGLDNIELNTWETSAPQTFEEACASSVRDQWHWNNCRN